MTLYLGLVHHPVLNRKGEVIASALTSIDLHDFGRLCRTYGIPSCFIITPLVDQHELAQRLMKHWCEGIAAVVHPNRAEALKTLVLVSSIEEAKRYVAEREGVPPRCWVTSARARSGSVLAFNEARSTLTTFSTMPILLLFGTAWGLHESVFCEADATLPPIRGMSSYNHLSVRCAAAIIVDRLLGDDRDVRENGGVNDADTRY